MTPFNAGHRQNCARALPECPPCVSRKGASWGWCTSSLARALPPSPAPMRPSRLTGGSSLLRWASPSASSPVRCATRVQPKPRRPERRSTGARPPTTRTRTRSSRRSTPDQLTVLIPPSRGAADQLLRQPALAHVRHAVPRRHAQGRPRGDALQHHVHVHHARRQVHVRADALLGRHGRCVWWPVNLNMPSPRSHERARLRALPFGVRQPGRDRLQHERHIPTLSDHARTTCSRCRDHVAPRRDFRVRNTHNSSRSHRARGPTSSLDEHAANR